MRNLRTVEKELAYARTMANYATDSFDNAGRLVRTGAENRRLYARVVKRLEAERDTLRHILQLPTTMRRTER